ncbi:hypothetical protein L6164_029229 [Bauhinia variegata]|uniref:Uncharacterized protein n=1 Tax=Bauhinia variegata TaxID=167791 RepID=A0ACB9L8J9_BAUVA|nr:hypothetical protein L6164_029229 [Bauhinia variegata]
MAIIWWRWRLGSVWLILISLLFCSASSRSIVNNLPGFGDLPFKLETGYIGVGDREELQLFYYFVESERNSMTDPLLIWLVGGPGCSALSAFFYENGPFLFNYANFTGTLPKLELNPNTWSKILNVIYVDVPVGAGFSYSTTPQGYYTDDQRSIENLYEFLQKWLMDHPEFESNPLYIGGGSYSGIFAAPFVQKVYQGSKAGVTPLMNIQGYVLASPMIDIFLNTNSKVLFAHQLSLISDKLYESIKASCNGDYVNIDPDNIKCVSDYEAYSELVSDLCLPNIHEPACLSGHHENQRILFEDSHITSQSKFWCRDNYFVFSEVWANDDSVRKALNVREGTKQQFLRCNKTDLKYTKNIQSVIQYHHNLTNTNLRSLIYCGDVDFMTPHIGAQSFIQSLNLTVKNTWNAWIVDGQVAGYTEAYENKEFHLTYATVKATGHVAQMYKPKELPKFVGLLSVNHLRAEAVKNEDNDVVEMVVCFGYSIACVFQCVFTFHRQQSTRYIGVGDKEEVQLFYYFLESQRDPVRDPLLLWLIGGPGCSALSGFFYENGPFVFNYANFSGSLPKLELNPNTWTKVVSIIYVDAPVGTGFSYSTTQQGYHTNDQKSIENLYEFIRKWLMNHPEFESNPLYIGGGSYSGLYVPPLVQKAYEGSKAGLVPLMNIQGYVLASPATDKFLNNNSKVEFAHRLSLIPDKLYESIKASCNDDYMNINPNNEKCVSDHETYSELVRDINEYDIYEPVSLLGRHENQRILFEDSQSHITAQSKFWSRDYLYVFSEVWANDDSVRMALNVREGTKQQFLRCNWTDLKYTKNIQSVIQYHHNLTNTNLRSLIYCGDVDFSIPHIGTQSWIQSLNLTVKNPWNAWFVDAQVSGASSRSIVNNLPGFGDLPFKLETGYIGVGDKEEIQIFYYFVESQRNPVADPLLVWLVGGPGCSGLSAFFYENGPLLFNYANITGTLPKLELNQNTWTKILNVIYVDVPVGAGFSYSTTPQGYYTDDQRSIENLYEFLQKWLMDHPEFESNPLYIGGGSYSGIFVAPFVQKVYQGSKAGVMALMNIQGYVLASPMTDIFLNINSKVQFAHQLSLIPDKLYESIKASCNGDYVNIDPDNIKCVSDYEAYSELVRGINEENIYEPACLSGHHQNQRILFEDSHITAQSKFWCRVRFYVLSEVWANDDSVRKALNVREGTKQQFLRCNRTDLKYTQNIQSVIQYHHNLTNTNLRSLIYCGDVDFSIPHTGTQSWIQSLNLTVKNPWNAWFVDAQVAGYAEAYENKEFHLTYATVKGAGHVAQHYKPKEVYEMIDRWFSYYPL